MKYVKLFEDWIKEGVRKEGDSYQFDWKTDLPGDIMSLKLSKSRSREMKLPGYDTTYTYYHAYTIQKSTDSTDLMKAIKKLDAGDEKDIKTFINKAVVGFDQTFGSSNFNSIVSPKSSGIVLDELVEQLKMKSGVAHLFKNSFVKAVSTDIKLDMDKVEALPPLTKSQVLKAFVKETQPGKEFKIKEVFSRYRKFFKNFIVFNTENDREFFNAVEGNDVILVDDFKTSGTTTKEMIKQLADAGARKIVIFILIKLGE